MIQHRPSIDRGFANHGWLKSLHSFSFGRYYDEQHMGFRNLRVINEDRVAAKQGFGTHPHRNMEIISYVISGALEHKDSMGTGSVIRTGDVQCMSAGSGVHHSEFNHSGTEEVHFLQIWITPNLLNTAPSYDQKYFGDKRRNQLCLVASGSGREGSLKILQDVQLFACQLDTSKTISYTIATNRHVWIQMIEGSLELSKSDVVLSGGDGMAISHRANIDLRATQNAHFLLFDLI